MTSQLDNPSQWATGNDAPTDKHAPNPKAHLLTYNDPPRKAFINTLASQKGPSDIDPSNMNKSEASMKINELKNAETKTQDAAAPGKPIQNPDTWSTGDDPASGKQTGYIAAMAREAGEKVPTEGMGKTEASKKIEELKGKTGM